jgi:DNA-directed RNA polymerase specialized sigma24 family protein
VVILRAFNELSFKEIGEILSESENWARVTFYRGKQKLMSIIEKGGI